jgi:adenosylcobyric acid synthase
MTPAAPVTPAIMLQGTGSDVGKSLLVAGLCRLFAARGLRVAPFKPQNMSNNAAATDDGGEIGRAQALQARAARLPPSVHMNPVLLKPESATGSQVIVQGQRWGTLRARDYASRKRDLLPAVLDSFARLSDGADLVIVEGAGSPAEVNLRAGDIANMGFAEAAGVPVVLVGDIDRGGVIASLVGCSHVMQPSDATWIKAFIINKFRGDVSLFDDGLKFIRQRTGWTSLGVVPWFDGAARLPAEDSVALSAMIRPPAARDRSTLHIVVPVLPRIANFDDLDPLRLEPGVSVTMVPRGQPLPGDADIVILPGSKSTVADLAAFRAEGWDIDLRAHVRRGGHVLGVCGGYQMLGRTIADPHGLEGPPGTVEGLGLLDVDTVLAADKTVRPVVGRDDLRRLSVDAYEIHLGSTTGDACARPYLVIDGRPDGAASKDGRIRGTYFHGLFRSDTWRRAFLAEVGHDAGGALAYDALVDRTLDDLGAHLARHLDVDALLAIARTRASLMR